MADEERAAWAVAVETHRAIRGRRWRVSDPRLPEALRQALVNELMRARRLVKDADDAQSERAARDRVHDAKVALGERGVKWWLVTPPEEGLRQRRDCARRALEREGLPEGWELEAAVDAVSPEDAGG